MLFLKSPILLFVLLLSFVFGISCRFGGSDEKKLDADEQKKSVMDHEKDADVDQESSNKKQSKKKEIENDVSFKDKDSTNDPVSDKNEQKIKAQKNEDSISHSGLDQSDKDENKIYDFDNNEVDTSHPDFTLGQLIRKYHTFADGLSFFHQLVCEGLIEVFNYSMFSHYSYGPPFKFYNDELSKNIFDNFIDRFDPIRIYLTGSEYQTLKDKNYLSLDDHLKAKKCDVFFEMFNFIIEKRKSVEVLKIRALEILLKSGISPKVQFLKDLYNDETLEHVDADARFERLKFLLSKIYYDLDESFDSKSFQQKMLFIKDQHLSKVNNSYINYTEKKFAVELLQVLLSSLDENTNFFIGENLKKFEENISLKSYSGVGVNIAQTHDAYVVQSLLPGGSAYKEGSIIKNDKIIGTKQDKKDAKWLMFNAFNRDDFLQSIRGLAGTYVTLMIERIDRETNKKSVFEIKLIRSKVDNVMLYNYSRAVFQFKGDSLTINHNFKESVSIEKEVVPTTQKESVSTQELVSAQEKSVTTEGFTSIAQKDNAVSVGYMRMSAFFVPNSENYVNSGSASLFASAVTKLVDNGSDVLLIDLRGNPGGSLNQVSYIVNTLLKENLSVVARFLRILQSGARDYDNVLYDIELKGYDFSNLPVVVLVDRISASASEVLSQAVKSYGRGIIVGDDRTFGKGSIQYMMKIQIFSKNDSVKLTQGRFYSLHGKSVDQVGVHSDIIIPSIKSFLYRTLSLPESKTPYFVDMSGLVDSEVSDFGFRGQKLLQDLSDLYVERFASNFNPTANLALDWLKYSNKLSGINYISSLPDYFEKALNLDYLFADQIDVDKLNESSLDDFYSFYDTYKQYLADKEYLFQEINYFSHEQDQKHLQQAWSELYARDYVLRDALYIAKDYFNLCRGSLAASKSNNESVIGCVKSE